MAKKKGRSDDRMVAVEEALSKTEQFIENNQKPILIVVGIIVVLVLGYFGYKKLYLKPLNKEAQSQMFMAEMYFRQDSLDKALYGDGNYLGFLDIIDDYGATKAGNLANYYTGIIYLRIGQYEESINYLKDFDSEDQVIGPMAMGALGDAHIELGQPEKAVNYYLQAANTYENDFLTPVFLQKAGWTYESMDEYKKALRLYEQIEKEYPMSIEARNIEKYIQRAKKIIEKG